VSEKQRRHIYWVAFAHAGGGFGAGEVNLSLPITTGEHLNHCRDLLAGADLVRRAPDDVVIVSFTLLRTEAVPS